MKDIRWNSLEYIMRNRPSILSLSDTILVVASKSEQAPYFKIMDASMNCYAIGVVKTYNVGEANPYTTFGEAYNALVNDAVAKGWHRIIIANDDIVLRPDTLKLLTEDADELDAQGIRWQWLAARTDWVRHTAQNIRYPYANRELRAVGYPEEQRVVQVPVVSPIFAMIRADRWKDIGEFAPISWFSDDEHCYRGAKLGYRNYVSRAYVHHVGSQTMAPDSWKAQQDEAVKVLATFNPEFLSYHSIPIPHSTGDSDDHRI